jgi:hypothetical protein
MTILATVRGTLVEARRVSAQLGHRLKEGGEYVRLTRTSQTLRRNMDERYRAIGRRVFALNKRARGDKPFGRFKLIMENLAKLDRLEKRFMQTRGRMGEVRRDLRRRGR